MPLGRRPTLMQGSSIDIQVSETTGDGAFPYVGNAGTAKVCETNW